MTKIQDAFYQKWFGSHEIDAILVFKKQMQKKLEETNLQLSEIKKQYHFLLLEEKKLIQKLKRIDHYLQIKNLYHKKVYKQKLISFLYPHFPMQKWLCEELTLYSFGEQMKREAKQMQYIEKGWLDTLYHLEKQQTILQEEQELLTILLENIVQREQRKWIDGKVLTLEQFQNEQTTLWNAAFTNVQGKIKQKK